MAEKPMIHGIVERYKRDIDDLKRKRDAEIVSIYNGRKIKVFRHGKVTKATCECSKVFPPKLGWGEGFYISFGKGHWCFIELKNIVADSWGDDD